VGLTRRGFQELAEVRIAEAGVLLANSMWDGAYYLAGYAVECALKACIAKLTRAEEFPDKDRAAKAFTHKLDDLLKLAGLEADQRADMPLGSVRWVNWQVVIRWAEWSRYARKTQAEAEELFAAITNPSNGVFPWIKARW